ncbi:hypothetical protein Lcho_3476 [Leptothrix cholodnii SP-6]|uniref:Uncharacterized protein n=1 Tax=Leptothrix cholodnii (strain ATCC 51168 / LMG 8142 / SP-6) TaxID=395495 RepID=B1Y3M9_LEPCP|nr:toprim domain-containing protein [Leptothrix cholodnii]ACB35732.1 hypothetical protein Lcho_3476 [Leptothrix cholodnii SP-6]
MSEPADLFRAAVLAELGNTPDYIVPGEFHRFSTNGRPNNRDGWCKLFADGYGGAFGCMRQGFTSSWSNRAHRFTSPTDRIVQAQRIAQARQEQAENQRQQWAHNGERNARLWAACRPLVPGDAASLYLRHRLKVGVLQAPAALRFHPGLDYWHDGQKIRTFPALVAAITSPAGELVALHRTYLSREGRKAAVPTAKKLTRASGPVLGGCIRLAEPTEAGLIGVAEGIETSLAAGIAGRLPVVAAYSCGALAAWQWPQGTQTIAICADADEAGQKAARELGQRALAAGIKVHVATPSVAGLDWCDLLASRDLDRPPYSHPQQHQGAAHE